MLFEKPTQSYIILYLQYLLKQAVAIYNFMINTYTPYVYNLILDTTTDPIYYSNSFACSNWTGKGKSTYQADVNPNEEFSLETIAYIVNVNSSTRAITLSDTIPDTITIGTTISVSNATTILDTYTYSADGNYTVSSIDTDTNTIYTQLYPFDFYVRLVEDTIHWGVFPH